MHTTGYWCRSPHPSRTRRLHSGCPFWPSNQPPDPSFTGKVDGKWDHLMYRLLPINSLRNAALLATSTPLVLMADVDLLLSAGLSEQMADRTK